MEKVIVRYKLKPGCVEENEQLIKEVYKQLNREQPKDFNYATYKLEDGLTFLHVAISESAERIPLPGLSAFKIFLEAIKNRCDELPVVNHVSEVGTYTNAGKNI